MLVDFRRLLPCAERFYVFSALLPANMQAALSGRKARPKWIDEANAGSLRRVIKCWRQLGTSSLYMTYRSATVTRSSSSRWT